MCGRYAFYDPKEIFEIRMILEDIAAVFGSDTVNRIKQGDVYPSETAAVLAQSASGFRPYPMEWGYMMRGSSRRIINARAETLTEKPMFAGSLSAQKCAIPCTGFYEWQKIGTQSIKHLVRLKDVSFFYLGGLYNQFSLPGGKHAVRFVIITTPANAEMQAIHPRMPLMIPPDAKETWLTQKHDLPALLAEMMGTKKALEITAL